MVDAAVTTIVFPCREGCRVNFEWGLGKHLLLTEVTPSGGDTHLDSGFGSAQWYSNRVVLVFSALHLNA